MKIAVTGAAGFIGRHLLKELASHGIETIAVIRTAEAEFPTLPCTSAVNLDIQNAPVDAYDMLKRPDTLIHLAWGGLPNYGSVHHFEQEVPIHYRFMKNLVMSGLKNLLVAGTCFEYGMQSGPLSEKMEAQPITPYGFAKDTLRRQLEYLKSSHPFNLVWLRLFYLYGDGQAKTSLYPQLRKAAERGDAEFAMSAGEQLRDYLSATELAGILVKLATRQTDDGIVNICAGRPISIRRLVENWIKENGWSISLNLGKYPYSEYEPMAFWGDRSKLASLLD